MEAYSSLLERTRVPQPSLQRFAVIQIFDKLRSEPNPSSGPGLEALTQCFRSGSPAVVDQSVRELCRLVTDKFHLFPVSLLELHSALEGSPPRLVPVFVRGIGFLIRFAFRSHQLPSAGLDALDQHPFIKVLSCRLEVQDELLHQVRLFVVHGEKYGINEVCDYIRPLLTFCILRAHSSDSSSSLLSFLSLLVSSLVSVCCTSHHGGNSILDMLIGCLECFHVSHTEDLRNFVIFGELLVDAQIVKLRQMVKSGSVIHEVPLGVKLLHTLLTLCLDFEKHYIGSKPVLVLVRRLLMAYNDCGLPFVPEFRPVMMSLFIILTQSELEDEELYVLDFLSFLLKWNVQDETAEEGFASDLGELHLFFFPIISLMSSPSKSVKQAASELLSMLEKFLYDLSTLRGSIFIQGEAMFGSKPEFIILRILQHLWLQDLPSCSFFLNCYSGTANINVLESGSSSWMFQLKEYASHVAESRKSCVPVSLAQELILPNTPLLLGALVGSLVTHHSLGVCAIDALAALNCMEPKLGVTLLLAVLYYSRLLGSTIKGSIDIAVELLGLLPFLALHSSMVPLITQTIIPMLQKDSNQVLYATALRLLCKAWEMNERVFGTLHSFLLPEHFTEFKSDLMIPISMAASVRDICRQNPDRGIELILSVAVCIECEDSIIKALGFESLGYLCEADVVDFYTAWKVISKHIKGYLTDPIVAYSLCVLLRWGAVDAEAYMEDSQIILNILWDVGSSNRLTVDPCWRKARIAAIEAITHFEVLQTENSIQDFKIKCTSLLVAETDVDTLRVIGELETKIVAYEHSTRRRLVSQKKAPKSKLEKLLDVFPKVIFSSGRCNARDLPGAAMLCLPLYSNNVNTQGKLKSTDDVRREYHDMLKEMAVALHLSRTTFLALLSLQSWRSFMQRWLKDYAAALSSKASSTVLDEIPKAADDILKDMIHIGEDSIPRMAENIALAIGAFCLILPVSAHPAKVIASKFLLKWLSQHEHEHRQWSAAISVGVISSCLHSTDWQLKHQSINELIKVACESRSSLIKGACGVGLGYSFQNLLSRINDESTPDKDSFARQDKALLQNIVRTLSSALCQVTQLSSDLLMSLSEYSPADFDDNYGAIIPDMRLKSCGDMEEDIWGVAGLVLGLGASVTALCRAGSYDAICCIKLIYVSWIVQGDSVFTNSSSCSLNMILSTGACLALPTIASYCRKVEMMHDNELDIICCSYENLITKLLSSKKSDVLHQNLLMASCVGAGGLIAAVLDEGLFTLDVKRVRSWLELFKKIYSGTYPHLVHLGAFLGAVNALGANAGSMIQHCTSATIPPTFYESEDLMQDMFLVAQNSDDVQLQAYAAWAISFLRYRLWSKELNGIEVRDKDKVVGCSYNDQSFSTDATVVKLATWLMQVNDSINQVHVNTIAAVLRCLSSAPRLPKLDWGKMVIRCMKYKLQISGCLPHGSSYDKISLIEECLHFSLAHANKFESLLSLLDDLTGLFRFRTLDLILQSCLLFHLPDLMRVFSSLRIQVLLEDLHEYFSSPMSLYKQLNARQKSFLQLSCWKGLAKCGNTAFLDSEYIASIEKCMEVLFHMLPALSTTPSPEQEQLPCLLWQESLVCLGNARQPWLMNLLQISSVDLIQIDSQVDADLKKILSLTKLVKAGSIPLNHLSKLKPFMLNRKSRGMWEVFVEGVAALQAADEGLRRQWLIDLLEISCITKYPSTALQFLALLAGSSCNYMPFLVLDPTVVLNDLPVTLSSLLSSTKWQPVADTAVSHLWTSTLRIHSWFMCLACDGVQSSLYPIDPSESEASHMLLRVMLDACRRLKKFLPLKNQLRLANMLVN